MNADHLSFTGQYCVKGLYRMTSGLKGSQIKMDGRISVRRYDFSLLRCKKIAATDAALYQKYYSGKTFRLVAFKNYFLAQVYVLQKMKELKCWNLFFTRRICFRQTPRTSPSNHIHLVTNPQVEIGLKFVWALNTWSTTKWPDRLTVYIHVWLAAGIQSPDSDWRVRIVYSIDQHTHGSGTKS